MNLSRTVCRIDAPTDVNTEATSPSGNLHGMRTTMAEVPSGVHEDTHLHVSFDLDCLDPMEAPGVGTGVRGGPTYRPPRPRCSIDDGLPRRPP